MKILQWTILILVLVGLGFFGWKFLGKKQESQPVAQKTPAKTESWQEQGVAIAGTFADAEVVQIDEGKWRMYYSVEPEVPNNKLELYSATSTDGVNWTKEEGIRKEFATFPDIVKLPDGPSTSSGQAKWRLYFQNQQVIKSAISADGLTWTDEPGTRIDKDETGFNIESVGAQSTYQQADGTYIMVYRGTINEPYKTDEKLPNQETHLYFWATSKDGLSFQKKSIAFDSRNETLLGATDGADWVRWDDGELRIYFWSYAGVYHVVYTDGTFSEPIFDFTNKPESVGKFSPDPPGDPTLIKIGGQWFMYYGQHTKGIYYATLK